MLLMESVFVRILLPDGIGSMICQDLIVDVQLQEFSKLMSMELIIATTHVPTLWTSGIVLLDNVLLLANIPKQVLLKMDFVFVTCHVNQTNSGELMNRDVALVHHQEFLVLKMAYQPAHTHVVLIPSTIIDHIPKNVPANVIVQNIHGECKMESVFVNFHAPQVSGGIRRLTLANPVAIPQELTSALMKESNSAEFLAIKEKLTTLLNKNAYVNAVTPIMV